MASGPTVQRRRLAAELRRLRDEAELTPTEAAQQADISTSALWRLEAGTVKPRIPVVRSLLLAYNTEPHLVEVLVQLARDAGQPGWWHQHGGAYPDWFEVYIGLESEASGLRMFQIQLVPGIFQTEAYTRGILRLDPDVEANDEVERKVRFRMARQAIFDREDPPATWAVLDEAVLHRMVGGQAVMREQLARLIELTNHPTVTIQVLPFDAGAHQAMGSPFTILLFGRDPEVVYLENYVSALYPERTDQLARYNQAFDQLIAAALSPDASMALIQQRISDIG
jgi:DNA-binding XRE family transcriptional regulator